MLKLYRVNGVLHANVIAKRIVSPEYKKNITVSENPQMMDIDIVYRLLERNERILMDVDGKFKRPDLYSLGKILDDKKYEVVDKLPEIKEEVKNVSHSTEEEKVAAKEEPAVEESQSEEIIEEEPVNENTESQHNKNRKQRHQNNK